MKTSIISEVIAKVLATPSDVCDSLMTFFDDGTIIAVIFYWWVLSKENEINDTEEHIYFREQTVN